MFLISSVTDQHTGLAQRHQGQEDRLRQERSTMDLELPSHGERAATRSHLQPGQVLGGEHLCKYKAPTVQPYIVCVWGVHECVSAHACYHLYFAKIIQIIYHLP